MKNKSVYKILRELRDQDGSLWTLVSQAFLDVGKTGNRTVILIVLDNWEPLLHLSTVARDAILSIQKALHKQTCITAEAGVILTPLVADIYSPCAYVTFREVALTGNYVSHIEFLEAVHQEYLYKRSHFGSSHIPEMIAALTYPRFKSIIGTDGIVRPVSLTEKLSLDQVQAIMDGAR